MLIAKTGIKYEGKRIAKGTEIDKDKIDDKALKELIANGAIEDTSKKKEAPKEETTKKGKKK